MATLHTTPQLRAAFALHKARESRHYRDCHCGIFGGNYCSPEDEIWTRAMNRELETLT